MTIWIWFSTGGRGRSSFLPAFICLLIKVLFFLFGNIFYFFWPEFRDFSSFSPQRISTFGSKTQFCIFLAISRDENALFSGNMLFLTESIFEKVSPNNRPLKFFSTNHSFFHPIEFFLVRKRYVVKYVSNFELKIYFCLVLISVICYLYCPVYLSVCS